MDIDGIDQLNDYAWPDPSDPGRIVGLSEEVRELAETGEYFIEAGHISAGIFQGCWNLRGMEQFMVDMAADPSFAHALLERVTATQKGSGPSSWTWLGHLWTWWRLPTMWEVSTAL